MTTKHFILAIDLKDVEGSDNHNVRAKILEFVDTHDTLSYSTGMPFPFPAWVDLALPDTTFVIAAREHLVSTDIVAQVVGVIEDAGATPGRVFVAEINIEDHTTWNNPEP